MRAYMKKITVELVKYDMDKTKKRKRKNFEVDAKTEKSIIERLERIHKGEKVVAIHEVVWGEEQVIEEKIVEVFTGIIKFYDNDVVEFEIGMGPKGEVAIHIQLIEDEEIEPIEDID
jgi:hypothetical protein